MERSKIKREQIFTIDAILLALFFTYFPFGRPRSKQIFGDNYLRDQYFEKQKKKNDLRDDYIFLIKISKKIYFSNQN